MMKKFTHGFLAFLFVTASTAMFAQQQSNTYGQSLYAASTKSTGVKSEAKGKPAANEVLPEVKNTVANTLKKSSNQIYFEKNAGQYRNPEVMYGFRTQFGSMGVYHNKLRMVSRQGEAEKPGEIEKENEGNEIHIVDITFPGSGNNWTVEPGIRSTAVGTYIREGKAINPDLYNEITLKNVYPGIDLRLYSGKSGSVEFDWIVSKASDYNKIKLNFNGQDGLNIEKEGNLVIKLHDNDMKMVIPETYQIVDGNKNILKARMEKTADGNTLCYKIAGNIDPNLPLVIDPVMIWSTYMTNGNTNFDEYLYAVVSDPSGNVYCAGMADQLVTAAYMSGVSAGYLANYTGTANGSSGNTATAEGIIYKFNPAGTAILAWTYTGVIGYTNNNQTPLVLVPTDLDIFPNGRILVSYSRDQIQIFSGALNALYYSGGLLNSGDSANYQSVCVVDDSTFYISGVVTNATTKVPSSGVPDATFGGSSEGIIMRVTKANSVPVVTPTVSWATYVGGSDAERFASIALSIDHSKLAFAVHSIVGTGYPATTANAVDVTPGAVGTTELLVGWLPVSATSQTAFSMFSYLGGSANEGSINDTKQADKAVICADNNYFYVGGNTVSTDLPGTSGRVQPAITPGGSIDQFISRIPWAGGSGFVSTYNGGTDLDLVGGIAVDFRSSNVLLFGTTASKDFPVLQTTPSSPYYQNTFANGSNPSGQTFDISYGSFSNDLSTRTYGTYIGGAQNDYLGSTGALRGTGHLYYNLNTGLINIGTTIHSAATQLPAQWISTPPGFDKSGASTNDKHFIFEWDPNTFDYGDAPATYEKGNAARSALSDKLHLGTYIDAESSGLPSVAPFSSSNALGDDSSFTGSTHVDDEDGVAVIPTLPLGATTYTVSVSVYNNTGGTITLAGWLDANNNGVFDANEFVSVPVTVSGTTSQNISLTFTGLPAATYGSGYTFLRIRLSDGTLTAHSDTGEVQAGEVEDYRVCVKPNAGPDQTVCQSGTAFMAASGSGTWTAQPGNPGTATIDTATNPTTGIKGFTAAGTYHYIWTNTTGCSDTVTLTITAQPPGVTIAPAGPSNICLGGSITLTASSSPAGGVYQWSPLLNIVPANGTAASVTVSPATSQTYTVVYSLGGCSSSANRLVTVYTTPVHASAGGNQTFCSNVGTTITLGGAPTGSGGSGNFTYAWSPPTRLSSQTVSNPTITSTTPINQKYYVTVTDAVTGCTAVDSMTLVINSSVSVSIALSDTDLCLSQFTSLAATGTPSGGTYQWSPTVGMTPSNGLAATVSVAPSANQTYTVLYSLAGCTNTASRTVNVYPNVLANAGPDQTFCLPVGGTITLGGSGASPTASGGSGNFTYAWSPAGHLSSTSVANPTITSPVASTTTYIVSVTDTKSGCVSVDSMVLTINSQATVNITSPDTNLCAGQSATLTAVGSPTGGTYQWSPTIGMTPVAGNTATVSVAPPIGGQTYQVTYTAAGCSGTSHKTVNVVSAVVASAGGNQTFCMPVASTITLGGSPTGSAGSGNFSYAWSPNTRLSSTSVSNPTITSAVASTVKYFVTVTDNVSGCTSVDSMTLTINPAVVANAGAPTSVCFGSSVVIGGTPTTGTGGTGTLSYNWSPSGGLNLTNISNPTASPTIATTYSVTVTDTKLCSATSTVFVTVNSLPSADAGPDQTLTACSAATVTIGGSPTGSGGSGGITYSWSPAGGLDSVNVSNPTVSHIGSTTTYTVTVTDSKTCSATSSVKVTVVGSTLQIDAGVGGSYCASSGGSVTLTGTLTGGTGPFTYVWSPSTALSDTNAISTVANPSAAGSYLYTLNVTDANGCNASDTVRVNVWPSILLNAGTNTSVCAGLTDTIGGKPTASGGSGSFTYLWSPGGTLSSTSTANPVATPVGNTTYSVTVTDAKNCSATGSVLVSVNNNPIADAGTDQTFCLPVTSPVKLGATPPASGGAGGYTYVWSPNTNLSSTTASNPTVTVSGPTSKEYKLTVKDALGCIGIDSTHLTILAQPTVSISTPDSNICLGGSTMLIASGTPTGGVYQWEPLVNIVPGAGNTDTVTVSPTANQAYQVIYVQGTCSDTAYQNVKVFSTVTASAGPNQNFCLPVAGTITLGGNPSASGGSGKYKYSWSPSSNLSNTTSANPTITTPVAGTTIYTLSVTDTITGCSSISTMTLTIYPKTTVTIPPTDTNLCSGQNTTLTAVGSPTGGTYQWSPTFNMNPGAGNTASVIVAPSGTQSYQVTYSTNGCSGSASVTVNIYSPPVAHAGIDQSFCLPYSGTVFLGPSSAATGGSGSYSYHWSPTTNLNDSTSPNPIVTKVNTNTEYHLTVTDNVTGCTSVDSTHLTMDTHATVSINATDTDLCFGQTSVLTGVVNPAGGSFSWAPIVYLNPGTGNTQVVTVQPLATQVYQLIYSRNACHDTAYKTVNVYPVVVANAGGNQTYCLPVSGAVTLGASHTATGGSGSYTYTWSPSTHLNDTTLANPTVTPVVASTITYHLTVTDAVTGCTATDSMILNVSPQTHVSISSPQTTICAYESAILTATGTPSGGNYQWDPIVAMTPANGNAQVVAVSPGFGSQTYFVYYNLNGCKDTASIVVTTYPQPVVSAGGNQSLCLPVAGPIRIGSVATGGSGNFTYHWSHGINLSDSTIARPKVDSLSTPGSITYAVTVTDNITGCVAADSMVLTLTAKPQIVITASDTNICAGQNVTLTASGTPAGGNYQWEPLVAITPALGNTATVTVAPTSTQSYVVVYGTISTFVNEDGDTITQVTGCADTAYQTIHVYPVVVANAGGNQKFCLPHSGTVSLGAASTATGGSGHYIYSWTPATNLSSTNVAHPVVDTLIAGTYKYFVSVTDSVSGCTSLDSMTLTISPQAFVTVSSADTNLCQGQNTTLTAVGTPIGGFYQWEPIGTMTPAAGNTASISVLPNGTLTYQVVYDLNGCNDTAYKTVNVYTAPVAHAGPPKSFCPPDSTVQIGQTATGGSGTYSYVWTSNPPGFISTNATPTVKPTAATTTYYVIVTDVISGCTSEDSVVVTKHSSPPVDAGQDKGICIGSSTQLIASGALTYQWAPPTSGTMNPTSGASPIVTVAPLVTTTYSVTGTDIYGCTASDTVRVTISNTLTVTVPSIVMCQADSVVLSPNLTGPNYRYLWSPGVGLTCVTCAHPIVSPNTVNNVYTLTITDTITGCSGSDTFSVTAHSLPTARFITDQKCVGDTTHFTDQSTSADPIASWYYNFGDTATSADTSHLQNPTYVYPTYSSSGHDAYEIVTTIYGCSDSVHEVITNNPPVIANAGQDTVIARGSSVILGATGGTSFMWSGPNLFNANTANPTATPTTTTTYYVTVTNVFGCTGVDSVTITVVNLPQVSAGPDTSVCVGNPVVLLGSSKSVGATYQWFPATYLDSPNIARPTAIPTVPGTYMYILKVTYLVDNIYVSAYDTMYLTANPVPQITATPDSVGNCSGTPYHVNFTSSLANTTYTWTATNGTSGVGNIPPTTIINNGLTDSVIHYTVIGTVPGGCTDSITVPVVIKPVPSISGTGFPKAICSGSNYTGTVTSGNPGAVITWTSTLGPNGTGGNINQTLFNPGNTPDTVIFSYTATFEGCPSAVLMDTVIINPLPHANAGADMTTPACSTDSIQIGGTPTASLGTPGYTYMWAPTAGITGYTTVANPYVKHLGANTTYTVTVTDTNGCTATDQMNVTVTPPSLAITISLNGSLSWCEGSGGSVDFTVNVTGGAAPYTYLWSPSAFLTDTFSQVVTANPDVAGNYPYTVVVTDIVGCQASKTKTIVVKPLPHPVITGVNSEYCANVASVPLTASIPGGIFSGPGVVLSAGTYYFRPSQIGPGTYTINYAMTTGGCTNDTFIVVTVDSLPIVKISGNNPAYCTLDPASTFVGSPAGGIWSGTGINPVTGVFDPSTVPVPNNTSTTVTIRYHYGNINGCMDSASVNITVYKSLQMTITASVDTVCQGSATVLTPHYPFVPLVNNIQWFDVNGTFITNSLNAITVHPVRADHGYYAVISSLQGCTSNDTIYIHVNQSPMANDDYDSTCLNSPLTVNVLANDTDPEGDSSTVRVLKVKYGTATVVANNVVYTPVYGYHGLDTVTYQICNVQCTSDCDTGKVYMYVCPRNLPPTADTIRYTADQGAPHDVNVLLATSDPNGDPLTISIVGTYNPSLIVTKTGNGAYTITGDSLGTYPIVYQVCDTDQYPIHVLCDTAVIFANIMPVNTLVNHPPQANPDHATTTNIQPAIVNVRGNDTDPDGNPLSLPSLNSNSVTAHGHFSVNADGTITFQPDAGLPAGIYYDTVGYCIYDITTINPEPLTSCTILVITTNVIDNPANRPPVAVDDHITTGENTTVVIDVESNDSDPDGDPLGTPKVLTNTTSGTITSVSSNGNVTYVPNPGVHSVNGQPIDSFEYQVCDTLSAHGPAPLCDTAVVYVYVTPMNLPPTADTVRYTALINAPHDINLLLGVSDPNGDPLTISAGPFTGNFIVANTGNGAYTLTSSSLGVYTISYTVCDTDQYPVHVLCATSVIIATIIPDTLPVLPPVANNDHATTTGTTPAVVNARGNDSDPQGNPLTPPVLGTPIGSDGTWSVDIFGNVVFTPNAGLAPGIYYDSIPYTVCDAVHPTLCASAWVIITTNEVDTPILNRPPLAVDDHLTVAENSVANVLNVKANDSDPDGDPLGTPTIIVGTVNGFISSVTTSGDVTYTPTPYLHSTYGLPVDSFEYQVCDTLSAHSPAPKCDTAEAYIYVAAYNLPPVANDIFMSTPENTPIGVNVASGAYDPNGDPLTYTYPNGLNDPNGHLVVTGNGSVIFVPTTGFIGTVTFEYQVCDSSPYPVHVLCDTGLIVMNVTPPGDTLVNHAPQASNDYGVTTPGSTINVNLIANDSDPDGNPINVTVTYPTPTPLGGTVVVNANGTIDYTAPATVADSIVYDVFSYILCDNNVLHAVHVLCDTALVTITINKFDTPVIHHNLPPVAVDDFSTICEEEYSVVNVLSNDIDPNGNILTVTAILSGPSHGLAGVSSPDIVYLPALYFYGEDSLEYLACDNGTPSLCDTAWVHYTVRLINHRPLAAHDSAVTAMNASVNIPVTINDFEPDGDSTTLAIVTPPAHGTVTQIGNTYTYTPDPGYAGEDTFYYRSCDVMNPTAVYCSPYTQLCDVGLVSIHVLHGPPHIPPTYDTIPENTPPVTICPLVSDSDGNSLKITSFPCGPYHGTVAFATNDSCLSYTPAHDFYGDDTICVVVCDQVVPGLCDTNKVYIHVTPICIPPVAVTDSYTVYHLVANTTLNVIANDTNNTPSALVVSVLTQPATTGIVAVSGSTIRFTTNGTVGHDQFTYSICSVSPACTSCDTGLVYINVTGTPSTPPVAVNDSASTPQDSSICVHVVANDIPGTNPIHVSSACTPQHGTNSIAPNGYVCYTPAPGYYGADSFCYTICDNSAPALCSTAIVHINVIPTVHPPVAVNDYATVPQNGTVTIPVASNDSDPDGNLNPGSVTVVALPTPTGTIVNINPVTGAITFTAGTQVGIDTFQYSICDSTPVALGGPLCATAFVYVNVTPQNHPPFAPDTTVTIPQGSVITVCPAFTDPDAGQVVSITSVCNPSNGSAVIYAPSCLVYTPNSTFYGADSFCYIVCDNGAPSLCDTGIVTVVVTHVPTCPVTIKDFVTGYDTIPLVINELGNDLHIGTIGAGYSVTILSGPAAGNTAVVNANGTITYTAAAGFTGTDIIWYKVTDSLDACSDSANITIFVSDTCVGPVAANDLDSVCEGSILHANVTANDYLGNVGSSATLTVVKNGLHGFAYVNTTSNTIDYVAPNLYHGLDTVTYQVCTSCPSGPMCSVAQLVIDIMITNHAPVAVDDNATLLEDHSDTINVVANDYDVDGDSLTVSISAQPANGTLTLYNNQLIYKPNPNYCGTDTFGYRIDGGTGSPLCPGQRAWDLGLVFVNVTCVNDPPVIPDTLVHVPEDSIITICIPYTDPDLGQTHTATTLCAPSHGTLVSGPTASSSPMLVCTTYKPDTNFYGIDSICVILCDDGNPAPILCDTSYIKIIVDPRNEPPVVHNDSVSTPKGTPIGINISTGAFDPNGDPLTYHYPNGDTLNHGIWTPTGNGTGVYTPTDPNCPTVGGPTCADSFTVIVCDNSPYPIHVLCDTAEVYISIYAADTPNHAPIANIDYGVTDTAHSIVVYVEANDFDPDGDNLTVPTIISGPSLGTATVSGITVIYTPTGPFPGVFNADSFAYVVCDTNAAHLPRPLCDTAWAYISITDTAILHNNPPVAVNDFVQTTYGTPVTIPVLHNDSDPDGNPIHITKVIPVDSLGTLTVNANGTVTFTPFVGPGLGPNAHHPDTFLYVICDTSLLTPHSLCDTAEVVITVPNSVVAVNDTTLTGSTVAVTIHVKNNDYDPELDSFYVVGTVVGPLHGTATLNPITNVYTYTPDGTTCSPTGAIVDSFSYQITDTLGARDTAWVYIHVKCCQVIANDDTFSVYQGDTLTAGILINDNLDPTIPHHISFVGTGAAHGTLTVIGDSVLYIPDTAFCGLDYFEYVVSDTCGRDTANVSITVVCANIHHPIVNNDTVEVCKNKVTTINVLANDYDIDSNQVVRISTVFPPSHGTAVNQGDTLIIYTPNTNYVGTDVFTYQACDNGVPVLCNTAFVYLDIHGCIPGPPDTLIRDTTSVCTPANFCLDSVYVTAGTNIYFGGFCDSPDHGTLVLDTITMNGTYANVCFTYTPSCDTTGGVAAFVGNDTMCVNLCITNGVDTGCSSTRIIITVLPRNHPDSIWANNDVSYTCILPDTIPVMNNDGFVPDPGNTQTGTAIHITAIGAAAGLAPQNGTIVVSGNNIIYTPDVTFIGTDSFRYAIADNGIPQQFDTATVTVYVCAIPTPIAVDDNPSCRDTSTFVNTVGTINVLANDTLFFATDTTVVIVTGPDHGKAVVNANFTITYTPDSGFHGSDNLVYQLCESVGASTVNCDTASVCIDVVDTVVPCFFPNGFSPNGDGINDVFAFPCNDNYPNATIKIFNRWGDAVYDSGGPYHNDWDGRNLQGKALPDGTYYFIYSYNDGSGKSEARFVVLHR